MTPPPLARVGDCRLIALPQHDDEGGCLTVLERVAELPFEVRRAFLISNVPAGGTRGRHANMLTTELVVCASGALTVRVDDGASTRSIPLSAVTGALLVPATLWVELRDFAPGTVVLVLADTDHREARAASYRDPAQWRAARGMPRVA
ncbi:MAG TPA: FdtA/QdtA family cupin domain-containing protein [Gemmatimonadaceae bacterium]|nr:FdtA/QdtA family cupin domain-containing protein [Gemmatimonadaceae bacterium]